MVLHLIIMRKSRSGDTVLLFCQDLLLRESRIAPSPRVKLAFRGFQLTQHDEASKELFGSMSLSCSSRELRAIWHAGTS